MAKYKRKTQEERLKEIEELTESFSSKIDSYFVSEDSIKEHLQFMSSFHNYSLRNMILIDNQFSGARAVGSYNYWKGKDVHVKKGEKGIKILAPAPIEYFKRNDDWVQKRYANAREKEQIKQGNLETRKKMFFKIGHVFEYTQTNAREKGLEVSELFKSYHRDGTIENDKEIVNSLEKVADKLNVKILDEPKEELGTAKGASYPFLKEIALNPRNTEYENVTVLIHELAHAKLHTPDTRDKLTVAEREFQAEMVSYVVANKYGIDTEDFSLSYLGSWTKGKELNDKEKLLNEVKETSKEFIEIIDSNLLEIEKSKNNTIKYNENSIEPITELEKIIEDHNVPDLPPKEVEDTIEKESPEDYNQFLSYKVLDRHKNHFDQLENNDPLMVIHERDTFELELKPFGEANNEPFTEKNESVKYTTIIPKDNELQVVSSVYNPEDYAHPLHHMEKNNIVNKEDYSLLESNYHEHLINEDNKYIQSIAPKIKKAVNKEDKKSIQKNDEFSLGM